MKLTFYGAAQQITGSMFLLETEEGFKLLIDCGEDFEVKNEDKGFSFSPKEIDLVLLTHAHLDHTGMLPSLYSLGYDGQVLCTAPTASLTNLILNDAATLRSKNIRRKFKRKQYGGRKVSDEKELVDSVAEAIDRFISIEFYRRFEIKSNLFVTFFPSGHLLGAAFIYIEILEKGEWKTICFSGDLGRKNYPLLPNPAIIPPVDYLVCETTYGSRVHQKTELPEAFLYSVIKKTCIDLPGRLIIPSFSVGRTQALLYTLNKLAKENLLPPIKVFADSPMAETCTRIYEKHEAHMSEDAQKFQKENASVFDFDNLIPVASFKESKAIASHIEPCIILSSSGMISGGRIQQHVKKNLGNQYCTILLVGYCAEGTTGSFLCKGEKFITVKGQSVTVKANIVYTDIFSGHGDKNDLLEFVKQQNPKTLKRIFLVHGEPESMQSFKESLTNEGFESIETPTKGATFNL